MSYYEAKAKREQNWKKQTVKTACASASFLNMALSSNKNLLPVEGEDQKPFALLYTKG